MTRHSIGAGVAGLSLVLSIMLGAEKLFGTALRDWMMELLARPTRYQSGVGLVGQRWFTIERETGVALALSSLSTLILLGIVRRKFAAGLGVVVLLILFVSDLWRVNSNFLVLTNPPNRAETAASPASLDKTQKDSSCQET